MIKRLLITVLFFASAIAMAQPLTMLVGFPPGGGNYLVARILTDAFTQAGHTTIIETKVGAGGVIGMNHCAENVSDNKMICIASQAQYVFSLDNPQILKYDPEKLTYVKMIAGSPLVLITHTKNQKATIDLIKDLQGNGKPVTFAHGALGNKVIAQEFFRQVNASNYIEVDYKGVGDVLNDMAGGHVEYSIVPYSTIAGKEKLFRIVSIVGNHFNQEELKRIDPIQRLVPKLPVNNTVFGLVLGPNADQSQVDFFFNLSTQVMKDKDVQKKFHSLGMFVFDPKLSSNDFKNLAITELNDFKKWKK